MLTYTVCDGNAGTEEVRKEVVAQTRVHGSARQRRGDAPAAGVTHQGWVGGLFAAIELDQAPVDKRLQLAVESISDGLYPQVR